MNKGLRFLLVLGSVGVLVFTSLQLVQPLLQALIAALSAFVLNLAGVHAIANGNTIITNVFTSQVVPLCTGDLELAVLVGAIVATADRKRRERIVGVLVGTLAVFAANAVRIGATIFIGLSWGFGLMDVVHTILFKILLVVAIVGFYAAWYLHFSR